jgi:hypothetical protein
LKNVTAEGGDFDCFLRNGMYEIADLQAQQYKLLISIFMILSFDNCDSGSRRLAPPNSRLTELLLIASRVLLDELLDSFYLLFKALIFDLKLARWRDFN